MYLFEIIYNFFVYHIFGGVGSDEYIGPLIGIWKNGDYYNMPTAEINAFTTYDVYGESLNLDLGSYLSLIATIISMVVIVVLCCLLIKKIYNICAHIIG